MSRTHTAIVSTKHWCPKQTLCRRQSRPSRNSFLTWSYSRKRCIWLVRGDGCDLGLKFDSTRTRYRFVRRASNVRAGCTSSAHVRSLHSVDADTIACPIFDLLKDAYLDIKVFGGGVGISALTAATKHKHAARCRVWSPVSRFDSSACTV